MSRRESKRGMFIDLEIMKQEFDILVERIEKLERKAGIHYGELDQRRDQEAGSFAPDVGSADGPRDSGAQVEGS